MNDFEGFESANTTPVPDVLFDQLLAKLSGTELKVLLYIIRRTRGFKKDTDAISLSQFTDGIKTKEGKQLDKGCGIKNRTAVSHALAKLEEMKCIRSTKGKDPLGDAAVTLYSIHFAEGVVQKAYHRSAKGVPPVVSNAYHRSAENALPVVQKAYPQETVLQLDSLQETVKQEDTRAASSDALTPADFLPENNTHSHSGHNAWNCEAWRNAHDGATCTDYQAYIDSGQREEADTEPRITAVNSEIGATDDNPTLAHHRTLLVREHHNQTADHPAQDLAIGATDGNVTTRDRSGTGISDRSPARGSLLKVQSPTGNPNGTTHTQQPTQVAIASTPGEAATPLAAITRQSVQEPDGAAAALENSGPRASRKRKPPQLTEREKHLKAWLEEVRGIELDLSRRDVTAIRSLSAKKGSDDKEMFLNVVAVLDSDPWFEEHNVGVDFYWIDRQWENKYMFLQRKKPKAALDDSARYPSFDDYVGNGPEERKRWREKSAEMKALGFSPDL